MQKIINTSAKSNVPSYKAKNTVPKSARSSGRRVIRDNSSDYEESAQKTRDKMFGKSRKVKVKSHLRKGRVVVSHTRNKTLKNKYARKADKELGQLDQGRKSQKRMGLYGLQNTITHRGDTEQIRNLASPGIPRGKALNKNFKGRVKHKLRQGKYTGKVHKSLRSAV